MSCLFSLYCVFTEVAAENLSAHHHLLVMGNLEIQWNFNNIIFMAKTLPKKRYFWMQSCLLLMRKIFVQKSRMTRNVLKLCFNNFGNRVSKSCLWAGLLFWKFWSWRHRGQFWIGNLFHLSRGGFRFFFAWCSKC